MKVHAKRLRRVSLLGSDLELALGFEPSTVVVVSRVVGSGVVTSLVFVVVVIIGTSVVVDVVDKFGSGAGVVLSSSLLNSALIAAKIWRNPNGYKSLVWFIFYALPKVHVETTNEKTHTIKNEDSLLFPIHAKINDQIKFTRRIKIKIETKSSIN